MIKFKKNHLQLGKVVNSAKMPYKFEGINTYPHSVKIIIKPICGCTVGNNLERNLTTGESFEISGFLKKRKNAVKTTKSLTVTVFDIRNKIIQKEKLLFTMDLIKHNDI